MESIINIAQRIVPSVQPAAENPRSLSPLSDKGCHRCQHTGWVTADGRGAKRCRCLQRRINRRALAVIPVEQFGRPKLSRLEPRDDIHPGQLSAIPLVKAMPDESYILTGSNNSGKSHIGWALFRHAIAVHRPATACSLNYLLRQYRDWELMSPDARTTAQPERTKERPLILPDELASSVKRTVFLDEFEKANVTEFASRMLFELLNAVRDFGHQLIVTSNKDWDQLREHWSRIDEVYGNSIMTRLAGCRLIEMF